MEISGMILIFLELLFPFSESAEEKKEEWNRCTRRNFRHVFDWLRISTFCKIAFIMFWPLISASHLIQLIQSCLFRCSSFIFGLGVKVYPGTVEIVENLSEFWKIFAANKHPKFGHSNEFNFKLTNLILCWLNILPNLLLIFRMM
jgi:hypothetical protein